MSLFNLPDHFAGDLIAAFAFALLACVVIILGVKGIDRFAFAKVPFDDALNNGNVAVGIVVASIILGICYTITHVIVAIIGGS